MNPYESPSPLPTGDPLHRSTSGRIVSLTHNTRKRRNSFDLEMLLLTGLIVCPIIYILLSLATLAIGVSVQIP